MAIEWDFEAVNIEGHRLRSGMLDLFASVEHWVAAKADEIGHPSKRAPLGQKLTLISSLREKFKSPNRIDDLLSRVEQAVRMRNDLVHSRLETVYRQSGEPSWIFRNVGNGKEGLGSSLVLSRCDFRNLAIELKKLRKELGDQQLKAGVPKTAQKVPSSK